MNHHEMLRTVSRTFALSIEQLPPILREIVTIAYLLFRVSDCIEDHPTLEPQRKAELLRLWADILQGNSSRLHLLIDGLANLDATDPEVYVAQHADVVLEHMQQLPVEPQRILTKHVCDTSLGMARWQEHGPFVADESELDDYMHQVAGIVGFLLTEVFCWYCPAIKKRLDYLKPLGREFGLALQTVNIIRGIRKDYERGWVFIPVSFYEELHLTRESFFAPENAGQAQQVVAKLIRKAEKHLENGLEYITALPSSQKRIRLFCIWPLLFAVKTLAMSRNNSAVIADEAKISRRQVTSIMFISTLISRSNLLLKAYYH
ncbi:MAG: squalene/phytoene synthase family protein, partial [Deltaproteobacteria bacterium]|nr:squalene/phytoene synthase family protein [Deltaproteobacteria bacterium]